MNSDLSEGDERTPESTGPDEERRAADRRVVWYFGDLLDNVIQEYPVARRHLVETLAKLDAAARTQEEFLDDRCEPIQRPTAPGRVVRLSRQVWDVFEETEDIDEDEMRAARAVHRRMAVSLVGADSDPAAPFFVFAESHR